MVDHDLGESLFEKRPHVAAVAAPAVAAIIALLFGLLSLCPLLFGKDLNQRELGEVLFYGGGACLGSLLLGCASWTQWKTVLRVHESGVSRVTPFGRRDLRFDQIDSFTYSKERQYFEGAYVGTQYFFRFGVGTKSLYFSITLRKDIDDELERVAELVSCLVAARMSDQLVAEGQVSWTERLRLNRSGVEYLHLKEWRPVPYSELGVCEVDGRYFYLRARDSEFPLMHEHTITPNFFPGLVVLSQRMSAAAPGGAGFDSRDTEPMKHA